jgi:hypothetical protein
MKQKYFLKECKLFSWDKQQKFVDEIKNQMKSSLKLAIQSH